MLSILTRLKNVLRESEITKHCIVQHLAYTQLFTLVYLHVDTVALDYKQSKTKQKIDRMTF